MSTTVALAPEDNRCLTLWTKGGGVGGETVAHLALIRPRPNGEAVALWLKTWPDADAPVFRIIPRTALRRRSTVAVTL